MNKFGYFGLKFYSIFLDLGIELKTFSLKNKIFNLLVSIHEKEQTFLSKEINEIIKLFPKLENIKEVIEQRFFDKMVKNSKN